LIVLTSVRQFAFSTALSFVAKSLSKRSRKLSVDPVIQRAIVDHGFIPVRAKLIEVAAFFDRVERYRTANDFRCAALREAAALLIDGKSERARRILEKLSDPTKIPDQVSSGKAAIGAWRPPAVTPKKRARK
jgi:hypothetical protein